MSINFDVIINTTDDFLDMKSGLDTLQGVSDGSRYIAETLLSEKVPERQTSKAKVRTTMKQSFRGSYGQKFSIDIYDDKLQSKSNKIGKTVFAELVAYFLNESIYADHGELSLKAQLVIEELGELHDELVQRLRTSALGNIHEVTTKFGHEVKIRYRKSRDEQIVLAKFDSETAHVLDAAQSDQTVSLNAGITRLNTHTGNGRLQVVGENETVAFGFGGRYQGLEIIEKRKFSENLHSNNGKPRERWNILQITAYRIQLRGGKVIKYIIE